MDCSSKEFNKLLDEPEFLDLVDRYANAVNAMRRALFTTCPKVVAVLDARRSALHTEILKYIGCKAINADERYETCRQTLCKKAELAMIIEHYRGGK